MDRVKLPKLRQSTLEGLHGRELDALDIFSPLTIGGQGAGSKLGFHFAGHVEFFARNPEDGL